MDVIRSAIDGGVNYIDMFWAHPEFRDTMGVAFRGRRAEVCITAHLGSTIREDGQYAVSRDPDVCASFFDDYLERMEANYADVLFLHNCNAPEDVRRVVEPGGLLGLARSLVKARKARFVGMSGHNTITARQVVESGVVDVLMFPINLAGYAVPGKRELLSACEKENVGLVAMKVSGGGSLLRDKRLVEMQDHQMGRQETAGAPSRYKVTAEITPERCVAYVLDQPQGSPTVPGAKSVDELRDALRAPNAIVGERDYRSILLSFASLQQGSASTATTVHRVRRRSTLGERSVFSNRADGS